MILDGFRTHLMKLAKVTPAENTPEYAAKKYNKSLRKQKGVPMKPASTKDQFYGVRSADQVASFKLNK